MNVATFPWTKFLRDPKLVTAELEQGDVVLHRRDEPDLQLTVAERAAERAEGVEMASSLLQVVASDARSKSKLRRALGDRFAWIKIMPQKPQAQFMDEFIQCAQAAGQIGDLAPLAQLLHEWKATAAIYADPYLARRLKGPFPGDGGQIPRP